jgi:uncharacterized membrane protein YhdT
MWKNLSAVKQYNITEDPRFKRAEKEAILAFLIFILNTIWVFGFAYWGKTVNPENYHYFWGMPMWMLWAQIGGIILYPIAGIFLALYIKECSLSPKSDEISHPAASGRVSLRYLMRRR